MTAGDVLLFCAFELGFVVVPGCLAYLALSGAPHSGLRVAVAGCAVGFSLEIAFYIAAAWSGVDPVFWAYPLLVGLPALVAVIRRSERLLSDREWRPLEVVVGLGLTAAAAIVVAHNLYELTPLPGELYGNRYIPDLVWEVAVAAEAKHLFPIDTPSLAGEALRYHYFANLNEAAVSKTTGIDQAIANWRLVPLPLVLLAVGGLIELGRTFSRKVWGGLLCAAATLFIGRFDAVPQPPGEFFDNFYLSDSFLLGMALFLALLAELVDLIRTEPEPGSRSRASRVGPWVVVAILMFGCSGAKGVLPPILMAGLFVAVCWAAWRHREQLRATAIAFGLSVVTFVVSWEALYKLPGEALYKLPGSEGSSLDTVPFAIAKRTRELVDFNDSLPDTSAVHAIAYPLETVAGALDVLAPIVIGVVAVLMVPRLRSSTEAFLCWGMLAVGALLWADIVHAGRSQYFFIWYPFAAVAALGAAGIVVLADDADRRRRALWVGAPIAVALLALAVVMPRPYSDDNREIPFENDWLSLNITQGSLAGLRWIRDNTPDDAIVAFNNGYSHKNSARNCAYTAFSERRAMLECEYGIGPFRYFPPLADVLAGTADHPQAERSRLTQSIFRRGDPASIEKAHRLYGVDYLVVDTRFATKRSVLRLNRVATRIHTSPQLIVYSVSPPTT